MMQRFLNWLRSLFRRTARQELLETVPVLAHEPTPIPPPIPPAPAIKPKRRHRVDPNAVRFERDVLDQLKNYMRYIKRMKSSDREAYDLYSKIGAQIVPFDMKADATELDPWFRQTLPAFGAVAHVGTVYDDAEKESKSLYPRFVYFKKMARPPHNVQQINRGVLYMMTAFFTHPEKETFGIPCEFPIVVEGSEVRPLLMLTQHTQTIRHRKDANGEGRTTTVKHQRWGISPDLVEWAAEHNRNPVEMAGYLFKQMAAQFTHTANQTIRVEARDRNTSAVFVVDILRTPQFFADREKVKSASGRTAPIFHIVRPHLRTLKNGKKIGIKAHFAGVSRFTWNGFQINITVPGKDHVALSDANFGSYSEETLSAVERENGDWVSIEEMGQKLATMVERSRP